LPLTILPCTSEHERALVSALVEEVKTNFITNLANEFCMARNLGEGSTVNEADNSDYKFVVVGASHASRLASALREALQRWRICLNLVRGLLLKMCRY
jgi:hypothetical protein